MPSYALERPQTVLTVEPYADLVRVYSAASLYLKPAEAIEVAQALLTAATEAQQRLDRTAVSNGIR